MPPSPGTSYDGTRYLDLDELHAAIHGLADAHPELVTVEAVGHSHHGRPLLLLTIAVRGPDLPPVADRATFWLDGGTHASEWTGVMSALSSACRWVEGLAAGDEALTAWFSRHAACVLPCISPDGYAALHDGAPFLRSSLRPPRPGQLRVGLDPQDIDGDGVVRWMRWRHPAGPYVQDEDLPSLMRSRRLDDDPADAFFVCPEGRFLEWDGHRWTAAPLKHGLDLNRNFPGHWAPFSMFGMDGGDVPLSEPESRAVVDAVRARPGIAAAVTNHTYTGALLTQPYRDPSPLQDDDLALMEILGRDAVRGTGYRCIRVHPDFVYDEKKPIVGVWADTLSTVLGVPGYTLELWDPFGAAGLSDVDVAEFFRMPDEDMIRALFARFAGPDAPEGTVTPWRKVTHSQLGEVEIGGFDYLRTIRNPPEALLAEELDRGHAVAERVRRSLPQLDLHAHLESVGEGLARVTLVLENTGFLPTSALHHAERAGLVPGIALRVAAGAGLALVGAGEEDADDAGAAWELAHLDGWGSMRVSGSRHPVYPDLPRRGHRAVRSVLVRGTGALQVSWEAGRAGKGARTIEIA